MGKFKIKISISKKKNTLINFVLFNSFCDVETVGEFSTKISKKMWPKECLQIVSSGPIYIYVCNNFTKSILFFQEVNFLMTIELAKFNAII